MGSNGVSSVPDALLDKIVDFPDHTRYERLKPITDFRRDPGEARILYTCRRVGEYESNAPSFSPPDHGNEDEFVMKVKVQYAGCSIPFKVRRLTKNSEFQHIRQKDHRSHRLVRATVPLRS